MTILKLAAALALAFPLAACGDALAGYEPSYSSSWRPPPRVVVVQAPARVIYRTAPAPRYSAWKATPSPRRSWSASRPTRHRR